MSNSTEPFCFIISVPYASTEYRFKCGSDSEATQWVAAITRAIHLAKEEVLRRPSLSLITSQEKKSEQSMATFVTKKGTIRTSGWMEKSGKTFYFVLENTLLTWYANDPNVGFRKFNSIKPNFSRLMFVRSTRHVLSRDLCLSRAHK